MNNHFTRYLALVVSFAIFAALPAMGVDAPAAGQSPNPLVEVKNRTEVSKGGITWHFDHPVKSGQFVNGDWWAIGTVTVVRVDPKPTQGPLDGEVTFQAAVKDLVKDIKGPMNFIMGFVPTQLITNENDNRMRNGSMVITQFGPNQGYDSRSTTYDPGASIVYPYKLDNNRTLISTISEANPVPDSFCHPINWHGEKKQRTLLKTAQVLTCLATEPPADAFRPAYAGTDKTIYRAGDLKWDKLLNLKLDNMDDYFTKPWFGAGEVATWEDFENYFQPVFLYHFSGIDFNYVNSYLEPAENQTMAETACLGREDSRLVSIVSLMVQLDVPREKKQKLVTGLVQRGIDLSGAFKAGNGADPDRCEWTQSGLKWPIYFSSLMLDKPELRTFPNRIPFHEDITTYYGTGWFGQTALWRIVWHDHLIDSDEERSPEQMNGNDNISEHYRSYGSSGKAYLGTALSIRLMKAIKIWGHDAFLDYCDRWIDDDPKYKQGRGLNFQPDWETNTYDAFVTAMWKAYRKNAPEQEMSGDNFKCSWEKKPDGTWHITWAPNPKPTPEEEAAHVDAIHKAFPDKYPSPEALAKLMEPEQDAASPKVRDECIARTQTREAEAKANPVPANTLTVVAAPDFSSEGGGNVKIATDKIGAVGSVVYSWDTMGHWIEWNVDVPTEGYYNLTLCYCSPMDRIDREITINGEVQEPYAPMSFPTTHGWSGDTDNWNLLTAQNPTNHQPLLLKLKQGKNAIRLTNINGLGVNVNYLAVTSPDVKVTRESLAKALPQKPDAAPQPVQK